MNNIISVVFCRQLSIRQTIFIHPFISAGIGGDLFMSKKSECGCGFLAKAKYKQPTPTTVKSQKAVVQ